MKSVMRNQIADYLEIDSGASDKEYVLMGTGFTTLDESPGANIEKTTYINESSGSSTITKYETKFSFNADMIADERAVMALYKVGRDHLVGENAEFNYVRVDLYEATSEDGTYKARKFKVAAEISDYKGDGGEKIKVSGTLNAVGDPVQGTFDVSTKTFTAEN